jgi:hypothetical protein
MAGPQAVARRIAGPENAYGMTAKRGCRSLNRKIDRRRSQDEEAANDEPLSPSDRRWVPQGASAAGLPPCRKTSLAPNIACVSGEPFQPICSRASAIVSAMPQVRLRRCDRDGDQRIPRCGRVWTVLGASEPLASFRSFRLLRSCDPLRQFWPTVSQLSELRERPLILAVTGAAVVCLWLCDHLRFAMFSDFYIAAAARPELRAAQSFSYAPQVFFWAAKRTAGE